MFRKILVIVMFAAAAGLLGHSPLAAQQGPTATRTLDPATSVNRGGQVEVTISAQGYGRFGAIMETLPNGFEYARLDTGSTGSVFVSVSDQTVTFVPRPADEVTFTYIVNVLDSAAAGEDHTFMGTLTGVGNISGTFPDSTLMVAAGDDASGPIATRTLDPATSVNRGGQVGVTISAQGYGRFGAIMETLPNGFEYARLDTGSTGSVFVSVSDQTVTFVPRPADEVTFTYIVNVLDSAAAGEDHTFMGTLTGVGNISGTFPDSTIMVAAGDDASGPIATRTLDPATSVNRGGQVEVTISAQGYGRFGAIMETLPNGFEYARLDTGSTGSVFVSVSDQTVTFVPRPADEVTFTYIVNVLDSAAAGGDHTFMGTLTGVGNISGTFPNSSIRVGAPPSRPAPPSPGPRPANNPPAFPSDTVTYNVVENSPPGTSVGAAVTATDPDGDTLTYALSGDDEMYFTIDNMGQIKVGADAMLDYETKETYMVTVTATDSQMATDTIDVTIMVTDVDERDPLVIKYDTNGIEGIQRNEVIAAIRDYLNGVADAPTRDGVIWLIRLYLGS